MPTLNRIAVYRAYLNYLLITFVYRLLRVYLIYPGYFTWSTAEYDTAFDVMTFRSGAYHNAHAQVCG